MTPREIVAELDRFIIGQHRAKRAVAVAVRNRWRRRRLDPALAREVAPKNIVMVGPTGVGKTEIARRLAHLVQAPFIKVEASKYTEVGYHGRDVESMIRDLLERAIDMVRREHAAHVQARAEAAAEDRLVDLLLGAGARSAGAEPDVASAARDRMRERLRDGALDDREVEITVREKQGGAVLGAMGPESFDPAVTSMLEGLLPERTRRRTVTVTRARTILLEEETERLLDREKVIEQAIERTEESGIVFLDEIDKIADPEDHRRGGADVSRAGVQRDLLPIVEGTSVTTRHGTVRTDQILFIAAGAFHVASVSDLMPELQGRFPIRVELDPLTRDDFRRILVEPEHSLLRQTEALLGVEGLNLAFDAGAIDALAELAAEANATLENIGARRLMTVVECVVEDIAFDAPERVAGGETAIAIDEDFVRERLRAVLKDEDLRKFVL